MAEGDVVDVEEAFFLALPVPDLVAGVAGVDEDGAHGALLPCGLRAVRIAGGVVRGGTGDTFAGQLCGDGLVAHAVDVHGEDPLHDRCGDGIGFEFVDQLPGRGLRRVGMGSGVGVLVAVGWSPAEVAALELGLAA
ncbi:hypothetical protein RKE30_26745 [Streptomyces sp. Li-HN-5-11]|nr:hypothetical protein [Streptomyces sp. Li-HN-5-11]WNM33724.1 hypothetical protein RKE30_26745 [Streptomyces sp. Li-HN-5-11]